MGHFPPLSRVVFRYLSPKSHNFSRIPIYLYVCMYVCMYVWVYSYIHTYIHTTHAFYSKCYGTYGTDEEKPYAVIV